MDGEVNGLADVEISVSPTELLNSLLNHDVKSLAACQNLHNALVKKKSAIQSKADSGNQKLLECEGTSEFDTEHIENELKRIELLLQELSRDLNDHIQKTTGTLNPLSSLVSKISDTEKCTSYLQCVNHNESISCKLQTNLLTEAVDQALDCYEELAAAYEKLQSSQCSHLISFIGETIRHWHNAVREKLTVDLAGVLKSMKWPKVTVVSAVKTKPSAADTEPAIKNQLTRLFKQLLRIQLPVNIADGAHLHPLIASIPNYKSPVLPVLLLVDPLKKRFQYHFYGSKQTNSLEKPEWFFTQLLTWAKDHSECLMTTVQPALWDAGYDFVDANVEFLRCLHIIAAEKLISCIPDMMYDEYLFSHLIHETLSFHSDMCRIHDYPLNEPSCIHILTAEDPFKRWIHIEKKIAQEAMDTMMESATAWVCHYKSDLDDSDGDQNKVAECAESFVTLLSAVTERYQPLPYAVCQLMFVSMKKELLEDYRIRLVQLRKEFSPSSKQYSAILNTAHYLLKVLNEWKEQPFFLKLQHQELQLKAERSCPLVLSSMLSRNASYKLAEPLDLSVVRDLECTLFDTSITNITRLEEDMLNNMTHHVITDLKAQLRTYADNSRSMWVGLNHLKHLEEQRQMTLSSTLCPLVIYLQDSLLASKDQLHRLLFTNYWQEIVLQLDSLIFTMVVSQNFFSEGGAIQFNFDMTRNLFPIIGKYTSKPDNFLKMVKESCHLLTLKLGDALLLKSTLYEALHTSQSSNAQDPIATVQEQGIFKLNPEQAELVLSRRNDLLRC